MGGLALREAVDGIETTLQMYLQDRRAIPGPGAPKPDQRLGDLARRRDVHPAQVDRLLDLRHRSKLEQVEAAPTAVGYRIDLSVLVV